MYFFVFDSLTATRRFERKTSQVVLRINDQELPHDKAITTSLNTVEALVTEALEKHVFESIIAVGTDKTARATMNAIMQFHKQYPHTERATFGFVPIVPSVVGKMLGMPMGAAALPVISKRRRAHIDVGCINNGYFIGSVVIQSLKRHEHAYKLRQRIMHGKEEEPIHADIEVNGLHVETDITYIAVSSMLSKDEQRRMKKEYGVQIPQTDPTNGLLQLAILGSQKNERDLTLFHAPEVKINTSQNVVANIDNVELRQHLFSCVCDTRGLQVIVGPKREF